MEQFFTLRQDVPNFSNITNVKEGSPKICSICESKGRFWSKINPRFLTVVLEAKEMSSKVNIQLYKNKVEQTFAKGNLYAAWQGLKNMVAVNSVSTSRKHI